MILNKMRSPIVWITLAFFAVLCVIEVTSGPVDSRRDVDLSKDVARSGRQEPYDDDDDESPEEVEFNGNVASDDEEEEDDDGDDEDDEESEGRSHRHIREATEKPDEGSDGDVIPSTDIPVTEKLPSYLELLSSALDKAIAITKIPPNKVVSQAAGVIQLLGNAFSEAIDSVIGTDDDTEETSETPILNTVDPIKEPEQLAITDQPAKVEMQTQTSETSQSENEAVSS